MILKLIGSALIVFSCTLFGYTFKGKCLIRIKELENMLLCVEIAEKEISMFLSNVVDIFNKIIVYATDYNKVIFTKALNAHQNSDGEVFSKVWANTLNTVNNDIYTKEEISTFKKFGILFSVGDINIQNGNISELKTSLIKLINKAKENENKLCVSSKIGIYTGIVISVFLL